MEQPNDVGSRIIALTKYGKRNPDLEKIQQAQDKYTASLKDAEHKRIVGEIFEELESKADKVYLKQELEMSIGWDEYEAIKARYLKEGENAGS